MAGEGARVARGSQFADLAADVSVERALVFRGDGALPLEAFALDEAERAAVSDARPHAAFPRPRGRQSRADGTFQTDGDQPAPLRAART